MSGFPASELPADRLSIREYRGLRHVEFPCGHLNLIIGDNGVGKSSVLEALWLLYAHNKPVAAVEIARSRDERVNEDTTGQSHRDWMLAHFKPDLTIRTSRYWTTLEERRASSWTWDRLSGWPARTVFIGPRGLSPNDVARHWDAIALTSREDLVIDAMAAVHPGIIRVALTASNGESARVPFARLADSDRPIPLRALGDGVSRIFGIAVALANASGGLLLIDEIENGIHYKVQEKLWEFLASAAVQFKVQVFATTHSSDTLRAFQAATAKATDIDGVVTRLDRVNGEVRAVQFNEDEMKVAVEAGVEIR